jgi:hypothetical protein
LFFCLDTKLSSKQNFYILQKAKIKLGLVQVVFKSPLKSKVAYDLQQKPKAYLQSDLNLCMSKLNANKRVTTLNSPFVHPSQMTKSCVWPLGPSIIQGTWVCSQPAISLDTTSLVQVQTWASPSLYSLIRFVMGIKPSRKSCNRKNIKHSTKSCKRKNTINNSKVIYTNYRSTHDLTQQKNHPKS